MLIHIKKLCDLVIDCPDSSDETYTVCVGKSGEFLLVRNSCIVVVLTILIVGFAAFFVSRIRKFDTDKNILHSGHLTRTTKTFLSICFTSKKANLRRNGGLSEANILKVGRIYKPCTRNKTRKELFKVLFTFSLVDKFSNFMCQVFDRNLDLEKMRHGSLTTSLKCLNIF